MPPLFAGECGALPFAVGCGFAGGGLREICPKEEIWRFTPFFVTQAPPVGLAARPQPSRSTGRSSSSPRRSLLELLRPDDRPPVPDDRLFDFAPTSWLARRCSCCSPPCSRVADPDQDLEQRAHRASAGRAGAAADGGARRGAGQSDQPALPVQHADVDLVADSIAAGDGARADREAVGPAAPAAAQPGALRDAARGTGRRRRVPRHRARPLRPEPRRREGDRRGEPRRHRAEHDPAAARRELDQARARPQGRRRPHHDPRVAPRRPRRHRSRRQRRRHAERRARGDVASTASACATSTNGCA